MIVHAKLHRHYGGFKRQHITCKTAPNRLIDHFLLRRFVRRKELALIRVRPLAQPRSIATPPHISEPQFPFGVARERVGLNIGGVQALLGDAVTEKNNPVTVMDKKLRRSEWKRKTQERYGEKTKSKLVEDAIDHARYRNGMSALGNQETGLTG
jgi:hypothetical protein